MKIRLYREIRQTGSIMGDGVDTVKLKISYVFVPYDMEDDYQEHCAEEYGMQDYSYRFDRDILIEFEDEDWREIIRQYNNQIVLGIKKVTQDESI